MKFLKYQKFRFRVNYTIRHNQHNQTQWHKVNDFQMISILYQNASTSQILEPSPQGLISSVGIWAEALSVISTLWYCSPLVDKIQKPDRKAGTTCRVAPYESLEFLRNSLVELAY